MSENDSGDNDVSVVVTGTSWMGGGIGSIESALTALFKTAEQEIAITAYAVTTGADLLFQWLDSSLARGVLINIVVNRFEDQPVDVKAQFIHILKTYPHFHLFNFLDSDRGDLHAKVLVIDRKKALIGSSNLSRRGLVENHEIAVLVQGSVASTTAKILDRLFASRYVVRIVS